MISSIDTETTGPAERDISTGNLPLRMDGPQNIRSLPQRLEKVKRLLSWEKPGVIENTFLTEGVLVYLFIIECFHLVVRGTL